LIQCTGPVSHTWKGYPYTIHWNPTTMACPEKPL